MDPKLPNPPPNVGHDPKKKNIVIFDFYRGKNVPKGKTFLYST